jgi:ABC-type multidrug transport system fused ATPase/permease subunit
MNKLLFNKISKIDYVCYEDEKMYNIIQRMGDSPQDKIKSVFLTSLSTLNAFIVLAGVSIVFFQISYLLTISLLIVLIGVVYCSTKGMNILNSTIRQQTKDERILNYYNGLLFDKNAVLELTVFRAIPYIVKLRKSIEKSVLKKLFKRSLQADAIYNISTVLIVGWVIIALFYSGNLVISGQISIGLFVALIQASVAIIGNVETLAYNFSDTIHSIEMVRYYYEFIDLPERNIDAQNINVTHTEESIIFDNVSFKYPGTEKYILKNTSFKIGGKEKVAIVGVNGAGKSTIIKLLLNLYEIDNGQIRSNVKFLSPVFQDYVNYYLAVRENVAFSDIEKIQNDKSVYTALSKGQASDILEMSTKKLDMNLGKLTDDGVDISGGQWQRLAVSRCLFPSDAFVILDEPTASMDPIAESKMYGYFLGTLKDQGCLIISHRLASAKLADKILILQDGYIAEQGTHSELLEHRGLYYQMFSAQSSWYN